MSSEKILEDIVESATRARAHYQMWWALANRIHPDLEPRTSEYNDFFVLTCAASYTAMFIYIGHLFDKSNDVSSIDTYLKRTSKSLPMATFKEFKDKHNELVKRAKPIVKARHMSVAHINAFLTEKEVFIRHGFTWNELRDLIEDSCTLVRTLARSRGLSSTVFDSDRYMQATLEVVRALPSRRD